MPAMKVTGAASLCQQYSNRQQLNSVHGAMKQKEPRSLAALDIFRQPVYWHYDLY